VSRRDLAEDLTSEAFLALYLHWDQIDASRLPGWLFTVVRNRARDYWRRQLVEQRSLAAVAAPVTANPPPLHRWMIETLDLKPVHRRCLRLHYVCGMTRREIAWETGLGETQVKGYLQYALEILRRSHR